MAVMPLSAYSMASALEKPTRAAFVVTTWARCAAPMWPERPPTLMIRPHRASSMSLITARLAMKAASKLMAMISRHSARSISSKGTARRTAALLTKTAGWPMARAASTRRSAVAGSVRSPRMAVARDPACWTSFAVSSVPSRFDPECTTRSKPRPESARAQARPIFRADPVTMDPRCGQCPMART